MTHNWTQVETKGWDDSDHDEWVEKARAHRAHEHKTLGHDWYDKRTDPRGRVYFWIGPDFTCHSPVPDSDVTGLAERLITVTPLQFNMTRHDQPFPRQKNEKIIKEDACHNL